MKNFHPPLRRRTAQRILDQDGMHTDEAVSMLLAAATRPSNSPLAGEELALSQFRAVTHPRPIPTTEGSMMSRMTRKIAAAPVAALGAGALILGGGGFALAASQGAVPFTGHDNRSDHAPAAKASTNPGQVTAASKRASHTPSPSDAPTEAADVATPAGTPSPSLRGLCKAFQAGALAKPKTSPAFAALTSAAGGQDQVATYCVTLLATPKAHPTQAATPTHPAKPAQAATPTKPAKPAQAATPTKKAHPTQAATPQRKPATTTAD